MTERSADLHGANLDGMVAVVTGATAGIGEATARALATAGAKVLLVGRRADRGQAIAAELMINGHDSALDGGQLAKL